jgi:hypothetical protein
MTLTYAGAAVIMTVSRPIAHIELNRPHEPDHALALGLVNSMVASRAIKEVLRRTRDVDLEKGIDIEREIAVAHMPSTDVRRGMSAFKSRTAQDFGYLRPASG